jgi:phosphatidylserine/phosphatidylglycerophosphate/cardiolipin synthase-like enzyme
MVAVVPALGASGAAALHAMRLNPSGPAPLTALAEPNEGILPIYRLITGARSSVELTMYALDDPTAEADLAADAHRGVDVRVLLDQSLERSRNTAAYDYLASHGVHVHWATVGAIVHQKTLTVDGTTSAIMSLNLIESDYATTRDFVVIDRKRADVAAIVATFAADFADRPITPSDGSDLVWSPTNAQSSIWSIITGAKRTLSVESEEMDDPTITSALAAAARRGVKVELTMTADPEWDQALQELAQAGVHVRLYPDSGNVLYIHAKAIVADAGLPDQEALVGSQNFSLASLKGNRELGILTRDPAVVSVVAATLSDDYAHVSTQSGSAANPAAASAGAGECTATASVYDAAKDENNVYVHSNQSYREASATADGYGGSYETDASGYAVIYLNGPPAGAEVTVTVGGATCTTRV